MRDTIDHALEYARRGWPVFPCIPRTKAPYIEGGLHSASSDPQTITQWWQQYPNAMIGVPTGPRSGVWAIDPDVPKGPGEPDGRASWYKLLLDNNAKIHTHSHETPSGGLHVLFKWDADRPVTNSEGLLQGSGINVRGNGGYLIVPPSRRPDGREYLVVEPLDYFCFADAPDWLYKLVLTRKQKAPPSADDKAGDRRNDRRTAYAAAALRQECLAVATASPGTRNNTLNTAAFSLGTLAGAGELGEGECIGGLYDAAQACGLVHADGPKAVIATINSGLRAGMQKPRDIPEGERRGGEQQSNDWRRPEPEEPKKEQHGIHATPFKWKDPKSIPRRQWLYGTHLIRKFGSATIAHPGVGKSSLILCEFLALATGRDLLGVQPHQRCKVWYWNGEDPQEETERRVAAACIQFKIKREELEGWLFIDSGRDQEIVIARQTRDGATIAEPIADAVTQVIRANKIDVIGIDPFISSHRVTENDNNAIDLVAKRWTKIAEEADCAVELSHHSRKTGGADVSVEDSRGGGALLAAVRAARVLNNMSKTEAAKAGITIPRAYFRVDNGKTSLSAPAETVDWFRIRSVSLGNGEPDDLLDNGDKVGVVTAWHWPDHTEGVTGADFDKAAAVIRRQAWRENSQAAHWVGKAVAEALDLDLANTVHKAKVTTLLKMWISAGSLRVVEQTDGKSIVRKFVEVADHVED